MSWFWIAPVSVASLLAILWIVGSRLPRDHVATVRARIARAPAEVWAAITDVDGFTAWRSGLNAVRRLPDADGRLGWVEVSRFGELPLRVETWDPPRQLLGRIEDPAGKLPFGGTWTWDIEPVDGGCEVRVTESGFVRPPIFRALSRFVFGHTRTMEKYLRDLGARFGQSVEIQRG